MMTNLPGTGQLLIFSNSKHTGFSIQNPSFVSSHRFSLFLPFTHVNWTKVPAKSGLYWNTAIYCDCGRRPKEPPAQEDLPPEHPEAIQGAGNPEGTDSTHCWNNSLILCKKLVNNKKTQLSSRWNTGVLGIENHKNNQHTHLNPNKPICTEPVKPPVRVSVIVNIWFTFFREIYEALQLVPKAQRDGENPQYTKVAALQQHETK